MKLEEIYYVSQIVAVMGIIIEKRLQIDRDTDGPHPSRRFRGDPPSPRLRAERDFKRCLELRPNPSPSPNILEKVDPRNAGTDEDKCRVTDEDKSRLLNQT